MAARASVVERTGLDDRTLLALIADGLKYDQIAARFGLTRSGVAGRVYRLRGEGHVVMVVPKQQRKANARREFADWMAEHGGTIDQAARALNIGRRTAVAHWNMIVRQLGWQAQ